ncbi:MAG: accessory gene regulator B family protein [Sedimentibacter sp.]
MISEKIVILMVQNLIIAAEDKELYVYGFHQGFILLANILTAILIGFLFNRETEIIIFLAAYIPLRSNAGGYHAKTSFGCYIFSIIMIVVVVSVIGLLFWNAFNLIAITTISAGIIMLFAPMEDINKPLDQNEKQIYKKRTYIILSFLIGLAVLFWLVEQKQISMSITLAIDVLAFMLVLGKLRNQVGLE